MLYLGHFSFSQDMRQPDRSVEPWHGHFTTVAEARDRETAVKKLRRLVRRLASAEMFEGVHKVYLDDCVEIRSVPAGGFLSHFSSRAGEDLGGIWTACVFVYRLAGVVRPAPIRILPVREFLVQGGKMVAVWG